MACNKQFFILTGDPGVGKTTLTKNLALTLLGKGVKVSGFYTEETRKNGVREGFDIVSLDGSRGRLAREQSLLTEPVKFKVGKYGVLVKEFEKIFLPCLDKQGSPQSLLILDEIGKMECFSELFMSQVKNIFSPASDQIVLATLPIRRGNALIENIRNHNKAKVWTVTRENRNIIQEEILKELIVTLNFN